MTSGTPSALTVSSIAGPLSICSPICVTVRGAATGPAAFGEVLELSGISAASGPSAGLWAKSGKENVDSSDFSFATLVLSLLSCLAHVLTCPALSRAEPRCRVPAVEQPLRGPVVLVKLEGVLGPWGQ